MQMAERLLDGLVLDEWKTQSRETVLVAGLPKGAGKTTLAMSVALTQTPRTAIIACDLGKLSIPPGVDPKNVLVLPYQNLTREFFAAEPGTVGLGHSKPVKDVYLKLTGDFYQIYNSIKNDQAIKLSNGQEFLPPQNLILDGMARLNQMLVDGQCALNNIADPSDLDNKAFKFWGKRLRDTLTIVEQFVCLPVNVILTTWLDQQKDSDGKPTGVWLPDIGGKMDLLTAGTVGAALCAYSERAGDVLSFKVRTKPDGTYPWCGVRDVYTMPTTIDVTISDKNPKPAWDRIFTDHRKK
jgi:hypothetical protein